MERNIAAINELADFVESAKFKFDMEKGSAAPACGSAGCIGGHAAVLWPGVRSRTVDGEFSWIGLALREKLGIDLPAHNALCFPTQDEPTTIYCEDVTRSMAVAALRRLAATGEVRFDLADDAGLV